MELKLSTLRFIVRYYYIDEEGDVLDTLESCIDYPVPIPYSQIDSIRKSLDIIKGAEDGVHTIISKFNLQPLHFLDKGSSIDIISVNYTFIETPNPITSIINTMEPTASILHLKIQANDKSQGRYFISIENIKPIIDIPLNNECVKTKERLYDVVQSWYSDIEYIAKDDTIVSESTVTYQIVIDNKSMAPSPVSGDNKCVINITKEFNNPEFVASQIIKKTVELILNRHE